MAHKLKSRARTIDGLVCAMAVHVDTCVRVQVHGALLACNNKTLEGVREGERVLELTQGKWCVMPPHTLTVKYIIIELDVFDMYTPRCSVP